MIILINGVSSSGKSSIIEAFNQLSSQPFLQFGIDYLYLLMPKEYINFGKHAQEGFAVVKTPSNQNEPVSVNFGPYGTKVRRCLPSIIKLFAQAQLNVIVDEVLLGDLFLRDYVEQLADLQPYWIGINCDLKVLEQREQKRKNRESGLARSQIAKIHHPERFYDLILDSSELLPEQNARKILEFIQQNPNPQGFGRCVARLMKR